MYLWTFTGVYLLILQPPYVCRVVYVCMYVCMYVCSISKCKCKKTERIVFIFIYVA